MKNLLFSPGLLLQVICMYASENHSYYEYSIVSIQVLYVVGRRLTIYDYVTQINLPKD